MNPSFGNSPFARQRRGTKIAEIDTAREMREEVFVLERALERLDQEISSGQATGSTTSTVWMNRLFGDNLLAFAAEGNVAGVRCLLQQGVGVNYMDSQGNSALHHAVRGGHTAVIQQLMRYHPDTNLTDASGQTARELATRCGRYDLSELVVPTTNDSEPDSFSKQSFNSYSDSGHHHMASTTVAVNNGSFESDHNTTSVLEKAGGNSVDSGAASPTGLQPTPLTPPITRTPTTAATPTTTETGSFAERLVIVMIGLPGRGKTYIARRIARFFVWSGMRCKIFATSKYKQLILGDDQSTVRAPVHEKDDRILSAMVADVEQYVSTKGIAIVDGTHSTDSRRAIVHSRLLEGGIVQPNEIVFLEIVHNDPELIRRNVQRACEGLSLSEQALFRAQYYETIKQHERVYRTLSVASDGELSFIRVENQSSFTLNRIDGPLQTRLVFLLQNLRHTPQPVYMCMSGEWEDRVQGRLGGDSKLTKGGEAFSVALAEFMRAEMRAHVAAQVQRKRLSAPTSPTEDSVSSRQHDEGTTPPDAFDTSTDEPISQTGTISEAYFVWTSGMKRAEQTCAKLTQFYDHVVIRRFLTLNDINVGDCDGAKIADVKIALPNTFAAVSNDPYNCGWPNGESMRQMFIARLEPHIHELQSCDVPVLVVAHEPIIQGLLSLLGETVVDPAVAHKIQVPLHTVFRITYRGNHVVVQQHDLSVRVDELLRGVGQCPTSIAPTTQLREQSIIAPE